MGQQPGGGHSHERLVDASVEFCAGWPGEQADQSIVGGDQQMLGGYSAADNKCLAGAWGTGQAGGWGQGIYWLDRAATLVECAQVARQANSE